MKNIVLGFVAISFILNINEAISDDAARERVFFIEERILLKDIPDNTKGLRLWLPYPGNSHWQEITGFKLICPFDSRFITDKKYGNKILYLKPKRYTQDNSRPEIFLSFTAKRKEYTPSMRDSAFENFTLFLSPNRLVPVNGKIKTLAENITHGKSGPLEKVRAIYDYIIDELTYSKDDPMVCGIGDSLLTLQYKKGICTDYHSLFISLVRSLGIPAKFEIGFPIPEGEEKGRINGYHCWAKFYLKDRGWIPVDISEADKHPEKKDYFFGHIDENRVHITTGRDIKINYAMDTSAIPLNIFVYPYAELNGRQFEKIDIEILFRSS